MHALLMTAAGQKMLVPRAIVAEVIGAAVLEFAVAAGTGLVEFPWRGRRVPLLRPAAIDGNAPVTGKNAAIAVFHGLRQQRELPFYGVLIAHSPRLLRLEEDDLEEISDVQLQPAELMRVRVDGEEAGIPKVDQLESTLLSHMHPAAAG